MAVEHDGSLEAVNLYAMRDLIRSTFSPKPLVCVYPWQYPRIKPTAFPFVVVVESYEVQFSLMDYGGNLSTAQSDYSMDVVWFDHNFGETAAPIPSLEHAKADRKARKYRRQMLQLIKNAKNLGNIAHLGEMESDQIATHATQYLQWQKADGAIDIMWGTIYRIPMKLEV